MTYNDVPENVRQGFRSVSHALVESLPALIGGYFMHRARKMTHSTSTAGAVLATIGGISLGVGLGAGAMYLFDPQLGARRRRRLLQQAEETSREATEAIVRTKDEVKNQAQDVLNKVGVTVAPDKDKGTDGNRPSKNSAEPHRA